MEASRQRLQIFRTNQGATMKHSNSEKHEEASMNSDMANWMTTTQLCSQASEGTKQQSGISWPQETDIGLNIDSQWLASKPKHKNGGAFLPFSKDRNSSTDSTTRDLPQLTLASSEKDMDDKKTSGPISMEFKQPSLLYLEATGFPLSMPQQQQLIGAAMPSTIQPHHAAPSQYCAATPVPPEFYTAASCHPPLPPSSHHHPQHHQAQVYNKAASHGHISPESDIRGNGDRCESIEDGKYESSGSKGENVENEGERRGYAAVRCDADESNESEITLKF